MPLLILICLFLVSACQLPVTNIAGAAVGVYETSQKRDRWRSYAEQGDVYAQYELAESLCCQPIEGPLSFAESYQWFCYAAMNGHAKAQVKMGQLQESADQFPGVPINKDLARAYAWYRLAANRANNYAAQAAQRLRGQMTVQQHRQADAMVLYGARNMQCLRQYGATSRPFSTQQ